MVKLVCEGRQGVRSALWPVIEAGKDICMAVALMNDVYAILGVYVCLIFLFVYVVFAR